MKRILLACLLLAACTDDPPPREAAPAPSPSASPSPSTSPSASPSPAPSADPADLPVVVVRAGGGLELHRVDRDTRVAALERVLEPPVPGAEVLDASPASASVCATWRTDEGAPEDAPTTSLVCYPAGSATGQVVAGPERAVEVAVSADGTRLAWAQHTAGGNQAVVAARLDGGRVVEPRRFLALPDRPETGPQAFTGTAVQDLAWLDEDELAISTGVESDDGPNLLRFDVDAPGRRGWLQDGEAVETPTRGYLTYDSVVSVEGGTALAVERGSYLDGEPVPQRAVRVDLASGRVLDVLATAADDRLMTAVSGSREAVVYVTADGQQDVKAYLRLPGEPRGTQISGLPADVERVLTTGRSG